MYVYYIYIRSVYNAYVYVHTLVESILPWTVQKSLNL